ncbi:hypothetical protein OIO90_004261 [Microbotryomycetes sp. JL221]|nr:hypothetical protein OIO90_004261 [Microbotryomycetes sp. JL221]
MYLTSGSPTHQHFETRFNQLEIMTTILYNVLTLVTSKNRLNNVTLFNQSNEQTLRTLWSKWIRTITNFKLIEFLNWCEQVNKINDSFKKVNQEQTYDFDFQHLSDRRMNEIVEIEQTTMYLGTQFEQNLHLIGIMLNLLLS